MKHLLSLFSLVLFVGVSQLSAQENQTPTAADAVETSSHAKKCSKTCAAKAAKAASMDESIEKKVCEKSGKVSYHKKSVCEKSGKVSYQEVQYDEASAQFVTLDETDVKASSAKKSCGKKKGCCAKKAKAATGEAMEPMKPKSSEGTN
jgi:hypothetical protein